MEDIGWRTVTITAVAPVVWGAGYLITDQFLPANRPLFAAFMRALPAGLILLGVVRTLPRGEWWWRAAVLGVLNIGLFFPLIFLSAFHLPGGLAATVQAASPMAVMALALMLLGERPGPTRVLAAVVGLVGVGLLVAESPDGVTGIGLAAAFASVLVSGLGFVLVKRWGRPEGVGMLTYVSWQLVAGGALLLPLALVVEGPPPAVDLRAAGGFVWMGLVATIIAYACWFHGLSRMPAGAVAVVGLLNPVNGTVLGVFFAAEAFGWPQALGMALVLGGVLASQQETRVCRAARANSPVSRRTPAHPARPTSQLATCRMPAHISSVVPSPHSTYRSG